MAVIECQYCGNEVLTSMEGLQEHVLSCAMRPATVADLKVVMEKVNEIHDMFTQIVKVIEAVGANPMALMGMLGK